MYSLMMRLLAISTLLGSLSGLYAQNPIMSLMMDEEHTGTVSDQSGKNNDAQVMGGVEFVDDRFGNECRAIKLDGYTGYLRVKHRRSLNLNNTFTVTAWTKIPYGLTLQGLQWLTLICKGERPDENDFSPAYRAQLTSATASINTASTKTIGSIQQDFPTGQWFHIALVYNGANLTVYLDGQEMDRFILQDPVYTNNEPLNIGRDIPGNTEYFEGYMDDLRLFNEALTDRQVQRVFKDASYRNLGSACPQDEPPAQQIPPIAQNTPPPTPRPNNIPNFGDMREREEPVPPQPRKKKTPPPQPILVPTPDPVPDPVEVDTVPPRPIQEPIEDLAPPDPNSFEGIAKNNLTLVLDVSGSMNQPNKLPLLKEAFLNLLPHMRNEDRITIVTFSGAVEIVLDGEPATRIAKIQQAIEDLNSSGKTRGKKGMRIAHRVALKNYIINGNNRVILATDAGFNINELYDIADEMVNDGITVSVFSFGKQGQFRDLMLDELAEHGTGNHVRVTPTNVYTALRDEAQAVRD